jgi:topoisomerase-4 subunit A
MTAFPAETTDRILVFSTKGRFYTLAGDKLPGGRGQGEPIRLMVDMDEGEDIVAAFVNKPERKLLVASTIARGFVVREAEVVANTRKGKQVLNLDAGEEAKACVAAAGDRVAVVGENRKMVIFPLDQVPEMPRGKGVRLQRYKDGGLSDVRVFVAKDGLTWQDSSGRTHERPLAELRDWVGERAQAGRIAPQGFPRSNKFGGPGL